MAYSTYPDTIKIEKENGILTITLDDGEMNTIGMPINHELMRLFHEIGEDTSVDAVIFTGKGRVFSAGGDIKALSRPRDAGVVTQRFRDGVQVLRNIGQAPQPIIAAVNGHAIGVGCTLALYCDIIIASEKARFADPHVRIALTAGDGGAGIWPFTMGLARAKQYLLTGDPLTAQEAQTLGLVNEVVPPEDVMPRARAWAERLARGPKLAIQMTKRAINRWHMQMLEQIVEPSMAFEGLTMLSQDHREATTAFVEKRDPKFQGR